MDPTTVVSLVIGAVGCFSIVLLSYGSLSPLFKSASRPDRQGDGELPELYEDEDGTATEETQQAYSDKLPKVLVAVTTAVGLLISLGLAVFGAVRPYDPLFVEAWMSFGAWVRRLLHRHSAELMASSDVPIDPSRQSVYRAGVGQTL